jgi:hypothetical protein
LVACIVIEAHCRGIVSIHRCAVPGRRPGTVAIRAIPEYGIERVRIPPSPGQ